MSELTKQIVSFVRLRKHLANYDSQQTLNEIVKAHFNGKKYPEDPTFVMMVGLSKSGKTHIVQNNSLLNEYFNISSGNTHEIINDRFPFLQDDNTTTGKSYWERQMLTKIIRERVFMKALSMGIPIVSDSCNLSRRDRSKRLSQAKAFDYYTVIIRVKCPQKIHLQRMEDADEENISRGEKPTWVSLYHSQKGRFEEPTIAECDDLIYAVSPTPNPERVY